MSITTTTPRSEVKRLITSYRRGGYSQVTVGIYALRDPDTWAIRYVGQTTNLYGRAAGHKVGGRGNAPVDQWQRELRRRGKSAAFQVIEPVMIFSYRDFKKIRPALRQKERQWITHFKRHGCDLLNVMQTNKSAPSHFRRSLAPNSTPRTAIPSAPRAAATGVSTMCRASSRRAARPRPQPTESMSSKADAYRTARSMTPQDFRRLRKRVGTQAEVATALGVSSSLIQKMEVGHRDIRPVYVLALERLRTLADREMDAITSRARARVE